MVRTTKNVARAAGGLYVFLAALGIVAEFAVRGGTVVVGDAAATTASIVANAAAFRMGLVVDTLMAATFTALGIVLWRLFRPVDKGWSQALLTFVSVGAGMILSNLTFQYAALALATDIGGSTPAGADRESLVLLMTEMHTVGYTLGGVFFGLWLLPLGLLALRSGWFPRALGWMLIVASGAWVVETVLELAGPFVPRLLVTVVELPTYVGEFWMMFYLLIRGVRPRSSAEARRTEQVRS
jgi:hypothetical protein